VLRKGQGRVQSDTQVTNSSYTNANRTDLTQWGCTGAADRERVDWFRRKLYHVGYSHKVNITDLIKPAEEKLLCKVTNNKCHVLQPLFPPLAQCNHYLRPRAHDFVLPHKVDKNYYIPRILIDSAIA